jgi:hypothetical protein
MTKFAKLFEVGDAQVVFLTTTDDEGDQCIKCMTVIEGNLMTQTISFRKMENDLAYDKAQEVLAALDQSRAEKFYAEMLKTYNELFSED